LGYERWLLLTPFNTVPAITCGHLRRFSSSSLKLSHLPPPDLRLTHVVGCVPNVVWQQEDGKKQVGVRRTRPSDRLAQAATPPSIILPRTAPAPLSFDFFGARTDKRWLIRVSFARSCVAQHVGFCCSCLSEFDLPGAGTLTGGGKNSIGIGEMVL
jgi:hypothetical protein